MATIRLRLPLALADNPMPVTGLVFLEGKRYRFTMRWSPRDDIAGMWRLDISDAAGSLRVAGVPLVTSDDVLQPFRYKGRGIPPGALRVTCAADPVTFARRDPGLRDFGRAANIEYVETVP